MNRSAILVLLGGLGSCGRSSVETALSAEEVRSLDLDALIDRLPLVGDEIRNDPANRRLFMEPAAEEMRRRIEDGVAISDEQWRRVLLATAALQFHSTWPTEIPFAISIRVPAWLDLTRITFVPDQSGWVPALAGALEVDGQCGSAYRAELVRAVSQTLGPLGVGRHLLRFDVTVEQGEHARFLSDGSQEKVAKRVLWNGPLTIEVEVVSRLEDAFPPRKDDALDEAVRRSLTRRHPRWGLGPRPNEITLRLELSPEDAELFSTTSIALEVELWKDGTLRGSATATALWDLPAPRISRGWPREPVNPIPLSTPSGNSSAEPRSLEGYSVRIRGIPLGVERLWHADGWWDGTVTVSLSDLPG